MRRNMISMPGSCAVAFALAAWVLIWTQDVVYPHDAPTGWSYPFSCCSNADCRDVGSKRSTSKVKVAETSEGYRISTTGEVVAYGDTRLKDSPDGEYHWCSVAGADDSRTICLFVPPRGF